MEEGNNSTTNKVKKSFRNGREKCIFPCDYCVKIFKYEKNLRKHYLKGVCFKTKGTIINIQPIKPSSNEQGKDATEVLSQYSNVLGARKI